MSDENSLKGMSVSMTDNEKRIVRNESVNRGLHNFSAALREIINEWNAWKDLNNLPSNGEPSDEV